MNENIKRGFLYGLLATLGMTIIMLIGTFSKLSPMPAPIPVALVHKFIGNLPKPALMVLGMIFHFLYGGIAGAVFAKFVNNKNILKGFGWGIVLWIIMQLIVLPILGWGIFGSSVTPKIAIATLILHLIYGGILGWGLSRKTAVISNKTA